MMQTEYLSEKMIDDADKGEGKPPLLRMSDGKTILFEPLAIAQVLSENKLGFYGPDSI